MQDPFSINTKNDWDIPETREKPRITITIEDVQDDEEGFLAELEAQIEAYAKENTANEKIEILGTTV